MHPVILLGKGAQVEAQFALFGDSANLEDRCTNCIECTICLEIYLEAPNRTHFGVFGDSVIFGAR